MTPLSFALTMRQPTGRVVRHIKTVKRRESTTPRSHESRADRSVLLDRVAPGSKREGSFLEDGSTEVCRGCCLAGRIGNSSLFHQKVIFKLYKTRSLIVSK